MAIICSFIRVTSVCLVPKAQVSVHLVRFPPPSVPPHPPPLLPPHPRWPHPYWPPLPRGAVHVALFGGRGSPRGGLGVSPYDTWYLFVFIPHLGFVTWVCHLKFHSWNCFSFTIITSFNRLPIRGQGKPTKCTASGAASLSRAFGQLPSSFTIYNWWLLMVICAYYGYYINIYCAYYGYSINGYWCLLWLFY
jgi:hypothetical protein